MHEDTESLKLFVERLTEAQSALYGCIHAMMAGAPAVADVLQETNRVLWKKAAEYDPARPILPWAYRVAPFEVLAQRKRQARDRLVFDEKLMGLLAARSCACRNGAIGELIATTPSQPTPAHPYLYYLNEISTYTPGIARIPLWSHLRG